MASYMNNSSSLMEMDEEKATLYVEGVEISVTEPSPIIDIMTKDGFIVEETAYVMSMSELVNTMLENGNEDDYENENEEHQQIHIPNVDKRELDKVITFCKYYKETPFDEIEKPLSSNILSDSVSEWYCKFIDMPQEELIGLVLAANFMHVQPLIELACCALACVIKGKTSEELRTTFNIPNDFTEEEEAQIREENSWCTED